MFSFYIFVDIRVSFKRLANFSFKYFLKISYVLFIIRESDPYILMWV